MLGQEGVEAPNLMPLNLDNPECEIEGIRINLGSGDDIKPNFLNVDLYDETADASWDAKNMPLNDRSVAQIISYQTFEHMEIDEVPLVLRECHRVLKPKGNIIIVVPDIVNLCERVVADPDDEYATVRIYGNQTHPGQFHKSAFTPKKLYYLLGKAGFRFIKIALFSDDSGLRSIYAEAQK